MGLKAAKAKTRISTAAVTSEPIYATLAAARGVFEGRAGRSLLTLAQPDVQMNPAPRRRPMRTRCFSVGGRAGGFTLLELAVVLFIIGLVMTIAMPYFGGLQGALLRSEARRLASRANYLYQEAGAQKVLLRITFDLDRNAYSISRLDPFAINPAFMPERGPAGVRVTLPTGVLLRDVWVEGAGIFRRGVVSSQFYPGGSVDATVVHLADEKGTVLTLAINSFSGRVAIVRGNFDPSAMAQLGQ
jgi:prepilin-type N-terminal cleavage/methylation domain-containing protein